MTPSDELVVRSDELRMHELAADLAALRSPGGAVPGADSWASRPAVLRRVAQALAGGIGADADRIAAFGSSAQALGSAVALASGLPFCVIEAGSPSFGAVHPGERLIAIAIEQRDLPTEGDVVLGARVQSAQAVFADSRAAIGPQDCLFRWNGTRYTTVMKGQIDE